MTTQTELSPLLIVSSTTDETNSETTISSSSCNNDTPCPTNNPPPPPTDGAAGDGMATTRQTTINIAKSCMGTGTLALPFSASQGGLVFNVFGLAIISLWNLYGVDRLVKCRDLIVGWDNRRARVRKRRRDDDENGGEEEELEFCPVGISTYGRVAWFAFGRFGLEMFDLSMISLFLGIIVAYQVAIVSFVKDTPFTTAYPLLDSLIAILVITPLSCLPNVGFLARFSASGLFVLLISFIVIFRYVLTEHGLTGLGMITWGDLFPANITAVSRWFGAAVFSYGIIPITYNVQESMAQPNQMFRASRVAIQFVFLTYALVSDVLAILYLPEGHNFEGDVLAHLPSGWLPTLIRLTMIFVVLMTAPLLVIPCGELIEGKIWGKESHFWGRIAVRTSVCVISGAVGVLVPNFVNVLSFIGCFTVSLASFVFPPLFYIKLSDERRQRKNEELWKLRDCESLNDCVRDDVKYNVSNSSGDSWTGETRLKLIPDFLMFLIGIIATIVTASLTFEAIRSS